MKLRWIIALVLVSVVLGFAAWMASKNPSNDRDWVPDQSLLPRAEIDGDKVIVHNVRNFTYHSADEFDAAYDIRTYDLSKLSRTWYVVVPFGAPGVAHAFLSFEFEDGQYVSVSVEARKERGEAYSPIKGAFRAYELMYVIGDERDVIGVRANHRKHDVYLYPLTLTREQSRTVFTSMLRDVNALAEKPQFYNTLTGSCMTGVAKHLEAAGVDIPVSIDFLLPAFSDKMFYDLGLIDPVDTFEALKTHSLINGRAAALESGEDFSAAIRKTR